MKLFSLFTGGKDSTLAIIRALEDGHSVDAIVTFLSENPYSYMFHTPNTRWTHLHAISMDLEHYLFKSSGEKEVELRDIEKAFLIMKELGYEGLVTGAVASRYQKTRIDNIARKIGLESISPLWGEDQEKLLRECVKRRIKFKIVRVAAMGLTKEWLGKIVGDMKTVNKLIRLSRKYGFNPAGEGGEYETFVLHSPISRYPIEINSYKVLDEGDAYTLIIDDATLDIR